MEINQSWKTWGGQVAKDLIFDIRYFFWVGCNVLESYGLVKVNKYLYDTYAWFKIPN
jgi:hypothetical protein